VGKTALWHVRNVALRAEAWVARAVSERKDKRSVAARDDFVDALREADTYAENHPEEIVAMPGAAEYLRGIAPLRQLSAKAKLDSKDRSEILTWHNKGVELFNRIVLAR